MWSGCRVRRGNKDVFAVNASCDSDTKEVSFDFHTSEPRKFSSLRSDAMPATLLSAPEASAARAASCEARFSDSQAPTPFAPTPMGFVGMYVALTCLGYEEERLFNHDSSYYSKLSIALTETSVE
jgi:hypothetical protein